MKSHVSKCFYFVSNPRQFMICLELVGRIYVEICKYTSFFFGPASNSILLTSFLQDGQCILPVSWNFDAKSLLRNWVTRWYNSGVLYDTWVKLNILNSPVSHLDVIALWPPAIKEYLDVSKNRGTPKWMVYLGVPLFFGNTHLEPKP